MSTNIFHYVREKCWISVGALKPHFGFEFLCCQAKGLHLSFLFAACDVIGRLVAGTTAQALARWQLLVLFEKGICGRDVYRVLASPQRQKVMDLMVEAMMHLIPGNLVGLVGKQIAVFARI